MAYITTTSQIYTQIEKLAQAELLWLDTEVADYTTKKPRLSLIQGLNAADVTLTDSVETLAQQVWMLDVLDQPALVEAFVQQVMMNEAIVKVFHNAKYDVRYLGQDRVKNVFCTLELAKQIPYYCLPVPNKQLKTLVKKLCQLEVCKEQQASDWGLRPLTDVQLNYASLDPVYLAKLHYCLQPIHQQSTPEPMDEDVVTLTQRHQEIYEQWRLLNSEMTHLEQRLKAAMQAQECLELNYCSLKTVTRTTVKTSLLELVSMVQTHQLMIDFPVTLTQPMQKQLGNWMQKLNVESQNSMSWQLKINGEELEED